MFTVVRTRYIKQQINDRGAEQNNAACKHRACKRFNALNPIVEVLESSAAIVNVPADQITIFHVPIQIAGTKQSSLLFILYDAASRAAGNQIARQIAHIRRILLCKK
jgi:hypothetical protein